MTLVAESSARVWDILGAIRVGDGILASHERPPAFCFDERRMRWDVGVAGINALCEGAVRVASDDEPRAPASSLARCRPGRRWSAGVRRVGSYIPTMGGGEGQVECEAAALQGLAVLVGVVVIA